MSAHDRRAHRRPPAAWAVAAVACLLLAACDDGSGPAGEDDPTTPPATAPAALLEGPSSADGGTVAVTEIGFSVLEEHDDGGATVAWAATFDNTSRADLLAFVDFQLAWQGGGGETEEVVSTESDQQRAYDVLPGTTAVVGGTDVVDFVPSSLDVSVNTSEWYPMAGLQARDLPVGVEVTDYQIEAGSTVRVQAAYTSSYEHQASNEGLRLLVAVRDAGGTLIGAAVAGGDFAATPAGEREQAGTIDAAQWPAAADVAASEATVVKVCCAWVAAG
jgi:hypothetical protein